MYDDFELKKTFGRFIHKYLRASMVTLDVQRSEQPPAGYMRYIRFHSFTHSFFNG